MVHSWANMKAWNREHMCSTDVWQHTLRPKQKRHVRWLWTLHILGVFIRRFFLCQTLDCSGKPMRMTIRWSAMWEPASRGMGMQEVEPWCRAQCVRDPKRSQDSWRMWDTHSMNSFGLQRKKQKCTKSAYNIFSTILSSYVAGLYTMFQYYLKIKGTNQPNYSKINSFSYF